MPSQTLPSSRTFVTHLLNSLALSRSHVPEHEISTAGNVLSNTPEETKQQLLALQVLFPNELLPALDLIDRSLVTRLIVESSKNTRNDDAHKNAGHVARTTAAGPSSINTAAPTPVEQSGAENTSSLPPIAHLASPVPDAQPKPEFPIYYVQSAQHRSSRAASSYDSTTFYQVRLQAWTCSCPAFAFAAFPATHPDAPISTEAPAQNASSMTHSNTSTNPQRTTDPAAETEWGDMSGWIFGGVSLGEATPPVCKHLLACVLVEHCERLFGAFVQERRVSIHEAAGWAAGWGD